MNPLTGVLVTLLIAPFGRGADPLDSWTEYQLTTKEYEDVDAIAYARDQFVVVGTLNSSQLVQWNSSDGDHWNPIISGADGLVKGKLNALAYGDGHLVTVGYFGKILTSPDATNWTAGTIQSSDLVKTNALHSVAYGNGRFVGIEPLSLQPFGAFVSWDGTNWEKTAGTTFPAQILSICYGNGLFVAAVGGRYREGDVIASSRDGINWTSQTTGTGSGYFMSVTYGGGRFVAVGYYGKIATSLDGNRWESLQVDTNTFLQAVCYGNGSFVAVGAAGVVMSSPNGTDWTSHDTGTKAYLSGIAYGNGRFVALTSGSVLVSQPIVRLEPNFLSGPKTTQLGLIGTTGRNYLIQFSTDLTNWTTLTNVTLTSERGQVADPVPRNLSQGFYRAVIQ